MQCTGGSEGPIICSQPANGWSRELLTLSKFWSADSHFRTLEAEPRADSPTTGPLFSHNTRLRSIATAQQGTLASLAITLKTVKVASIPLCKIDEPHRPCLSSHLRVLMCRHLFYLEVSAHRIALNSASLALLQVNKSSK